MSWRNEMVLIVRYLINDIDASTYTTSRLEQSILIGAQLSVYEIDFSVTYSIDTDEETLSPDPTTPTRDDAFINLVCLKTAHIILRNEAKLKANEAVSITDAASKIDLVERYKAFQKQADEMKDAYEQAKIEYATGVGSPGKAIVGPITNEAIFSRRGNI